jgi:hypothetical protein
MFPNEELPSDEAKVREIWDALVLGESIAPEENGDEISATIAAFLEIDSTPSLDSGRQDAIWKSIQASMPITAVAGTVFSTNGHHPVLEISESAPPEAPASAKSPSPRRRAADVYRGLAIGVMAGMVAGGIAGGLGTRLAMRIAGSLSDGITRRMLTQDGNSVGNMSVEGTISLVFFAAFVGIAGGILYMPFRSLFPSQERYKGLLYGVSLLLIFGFVIMDQGNPDYRTFGSPAINIGTFSACYILFGLIVAPVAGWLDQHLPTWPLTRAIAWRNVIGHATIVFFGGIGLIATLTTLMIGGGFVVITLGVSFAAALAARLYESRFRGRRVSWRRPTPLVRYAMLGAPAAAGFIITVRSVASILGLG